MLLQGSALRLDFGDAEEPNVTERHYLPDTEALAERFKACLQVRYTKITGNRTCVHMNMIRTAICGRLLGQPAWGYLQSMLRCIL